MLAMGFLIVVGIVDITLFPRKFRQAVYGEIWIKKVFMLFFQVFSVII